MKPYLTWLSKLSLLRVTIALSSLLLTQCIHTKVKRPDLNGIYDEAAKKSDLERNPIIVIPGVLGSQLYDPEEKKVIWGVYDTKFTGTSKPSSMRLVALPMESGKSLSQLTDSIVSTKTLDRLKLRVLGLPIEPRAYASILATLGVGGYRDEELAESGAIDYGDDHFSCFQFHYDWRRSNAENAARLDRFIKQKRKLVRTNIKERYGVDKKNIKFDIIAHSMGGLMTRYYLRYGQQALPTEGPQLPKLNWAGAKNVEKLIIVGTPNSGSILAFEQLLEGQKLGPDSLNLLPFTNIPKYPASVLGTYPSIYELMPRTRHKAFIDESGNPLDIYNADLWSKNNWGLLNPKSKKALEWQLPDIQSATERRAVAYDHIRKSLNSAKKFHQALDKKAKKPAQLSITLVAGDASQTKERMTIQADGSFKYTALAPGDGTVLRSSVLADQRAGGAYSSSVNSAIDYDRVIFLPQDHLGLTKDITFSDNILHILLEE